MSRDRVSCATFLCPLSILSKNSMELYKTAQPLAPLCIPFHHFTKPLRKPRVTLDALYCVGGKPRRMLFELCGNRVFLRCQKTSAAVERGADFCIVRNDLADFAQLPKLRGVADRVPPCFLRLWAVGFPDLMV